MSTLAEVSFVDNTSAVGCSSIEGVQSRHLSEISLQATLLIWLIH